MLVSEVLVCVRGKITGFLCMLEVLFVASWLSGNGFMGSTLMHKP